MIKHLFFFFISLSISYLSAQNTSPTSSLTDSLSVELAKATNDTDRLAFLLKNPATKYVEQADAILKLYKQGYVWAEKIKDKKSKARLDFYVGFIYAYGKADEGTAFQYYQKALQQAEAINDTEGCALILYSMGIVYDHQGFRDKMHTCFKQSFAHIEKNFTPALLRPALSIQTTLGNDKRFEEAIAVGKKIIDWVEKNNLGIQDQLYAYAVFMSELKVAKKPAAEIDYYKNKVAQLIHTVKPNNDAAEMYYITKICFETEFYDLAIKYGNVVLNIKNKNKNTTYFQATTHETLANIYEITQNYPLSIQHYKDFIQLTVNNIQKEMTEDAGRKVIKLEAERDLAIKQKEIETQRLYTLLAVVVALLVLGLGGVIYYFYQREQQQKEELARLNTTKDKLFALLSHDLMSPVSALKNYTMLMDWGGMNQEAFSKALQRLKGSVNHTHSLLENVLHWAVGQMDGIKPKTEDVHLASVVNEQVALIEPIAKDKRIEITQHISDDFNIPFDKNHLTLILRNLLQNALKFTNANGNITISTTHSEQGQRLLSITDNGVGMSEEIMSKLFNVNENMHRKGTQSEGGTGLGLILTKELIELNGGTIEVSSQLNEGTTFVVGFYQ
jgi:signal transduction histidine kinase